MEDFANPDINEITCLCSAQSAKTVMMMALLAWAIAEDPGPILWVTGNAKEATKFAKARLMPMLEQCAPIVEKINKQASGRHDKTTTAIYFPGAPLFITGADSPLSLQSTPFRYIFLDEVRSWKPGALEMVSKRIRSFPHTYKKLIVSTPGGENDGLHRAFMKGSQTRWLFKCPKCGEKHPYGWGKEEEKGGLKWKMDEDTVINGEYQWDELLESIRYECPHCETRWQDVERNRKIIAKSGEWEDVNLAHASNVRSYTWNALLPWWPSWKMQVQEWLEANKALKNGAWHPLRDHVTETRGEVWSDERRFSNDEAILEERSVDYSLDDFQNVAMAVGRYATSELPFFVGEWQEARRIMSVDVQGKGGRHFFTVIRSWSPDGKSRLLDADKCWTWEEIRSKAKEWSVHPKNVCIDAAHFTGEVYTKVLESGNCWKAFKGDAKDYMIVTNAQGNRVRSIWQKTLADPGIGTRMSGKMGTVPLYVFSKPSTIDRLDMCIHGLVDGWEIPLFTSDDYRLQVTAYYRHEFLDTRGMPRTEWRSKRDDHFADCERMQIAAATILKLIHFFPNG